MSTGIPRLSRPEDLLENSIFARFFCKSVGMGEFSGLVHSGTGRPG